MAERKAHGGSRSGAGRPKGRLSGPKVTTREKTLVEQEYRAFMLRHCQGLWQVQLQRALGAFVLMMQTKPGVIERVTDPERIARVMATPSDHANFWWIESRPPDPVLVKEINNRLMGVPAQPHEVSTSLSLAEILAGMSPKDEER